MRTRDWKLFELLAICSLFFFSRCGYEWQGFSSDNPLPTLYVPLVQGDEDGDFTSHLLEKLHQAKAFQLVRKTADYRLEVAIKKGEETTIGFRRDIELIKGHVTHNLIASEGRKAIQIEATVFQGSSEKKVFGPYTLQAEADYDYVIGDALRDLTFSSPTGSLVVVLPFSLGQLEPLESAREASLKPIYAKLSQKIVDALLTEW